MQERRSDQPWSAIVRVPGARAAVRFVRRPLLAPPQYFGGDRDETPRGVPLLRSIIVASTPRTGSQLLSLALRATGVAGAADEFFNPTRMTSAADELGVPSLTARARMTRQLRRWTFRPAWGLSEDFEPSTVPAYLDHLLATRVTPNGVFSIKVHWSEFERIRVRYGFDPEQLPQPVAWIFLSRRDLAAQAASHSLAKRTGIWSTAGPLPRLGVEIPNYDDERMMAGYLLARDGGSSWERYFAANGIEPIRVVYEDLAADFDGTVRRVFGELDLDAPVPEPELDRQANEVNEAWARRFRADHPDLFDGPVR